MTQMRGALFKQKSTADSVICGTFTICRKKRSSRTLRPLYTLQAFAQRDKQQQADGKIARAVEEIERDAVDPVRYAPGRPGHKGVCHGVQRAVAKAEDAAQKRPQQHRIVVARKVRQPDQDRPDIQLREPPKPESVQKAVNEQISIYGGEHKLWIFQCV